MTHIPKGSKLSDLYGPTKFSIPVKSFKRPFLIHYAQRNPTTGRMEYTYASIGTPQNLIDFQVKLTAGHVEMIDGLSLTVQLFGVLMEQAGLTEDSDATMDFTLPEGPTPEDAPKACPRRSWDNVAKGVPQNVTCGHVGKPQPRMLCNRQNCPDKDIQNDDRYW